MQRDSETPRVLSSSSLQDAQRCLRYFYLRHVRGWDTSRPSYDLRFGAAWHEGMDVLVRTRNVAEAFERFLDCLIENGGAEEHRSKTPEAAAESYKIYLDMYGKELDGHEVLGTEIYAKVPVTPDGRLVMSVRLDLVLKTPKGRALVIDHKTAGGRYSYLGDLYNMRFQTNLYLYAAKAIFGMDAEMTINVCVFLKDGPEFIRFPILRSQRQLEAWLASAWFWLGTVQRELELLDEAPEGDVLYAFPMNGEGCVKYNRTCPFIDICYTHQNPAKLNEPPPGFVYRPWDSKDYAKAILEAKDNVFELKLED